MELVHFAVLLFLFVVVLWVLLLCLFGVGPRQTQEQNLQQLNKKVLNFYEYCDGFAQGIAGQQPGGHVLAIKPRKNSVEVFSSCPRMDRCYYTHGQVTSHKSV
jgi:F0F1-type ATP synthase membrane subunit a